MVREPPESLASRAARAYGITDARDYGRAVWTIVVGQVFAATGRGVAVPFIVIYLTREVGIALAVIGVGILVEQIVRALGGPAAGWAADQVGRKPVMIAGLLATAVAVPGYVLVTGEASFLVLSVLVGAAQAVYLPASSAFIADVTRPERRAGAYGLIHVARNLGWAVGVGIGALITASTTSFVPLFLVGGVAPLLYAGVVAAFVREPARQAPRVGPANPFRDFGALLGSRPFVAYMALASGFFLLWGVFNTVLPLFVVDGLGHPRAAVAVPFALNPILIVLFQLPFGALGDRVDRWRALAVAAVFGALGYGALAWAEPLLGLGLPSLGTVVIGTVALTVAEMLFSPVLTAAAAELSPPHLRGSAMGVFAFGSALGHGAAPLLAGFITDGFGWSWFWTVLAAWTVVSGTGLVVARTRLRDAVAENERPAVVA